MSRGPGRSTNKIYTKYYNGGDTMSVVDFNVLKEKQKLQAELKEWQERLRLAYDYDWKDPSRAICHSEVKRLKELLEPETILDKINRLK